MKSHLFLACGTFAVVFATPLPLRSVTDEPVLRVGHGVTAPRPLNQLDPEYSDEARRAGLQGKCVLSLVVNSEGKPVDIRVSRSLGMGLDEKAVEALRRWTFEPARKDGKPVSVKVRVVMTFHIGKGFGKMPLVQRKAIERMQKEAAEYAWTHVYRVEASANDSRCRPTQEESNPVSISGLLEARQYRLESITFTGNKNLSNAAVLRHMFPLQDGDPFDPKKVSDGLQQLKKAYGAQGFASFKATVEPEIDDANRRIALRIRCHEGRQFYVHHVNIAGLDEDTFQRLRKTLYVKPGSLYNETLADFWLAKNSHLLPPDDSIRDRIKVDLNENEGQLVMTYDFTRCAD